MRLRLTNILKEYSTGIVNKLKQNFKQQNSGLTDEQMDYYINRFDQLKSSPRIEEKDIMKYTFQQLEQIVDSFPTKGKITKGGGNNVEFSQTELIFNHSPLQIYHGDSEKSCIKIKGDFQATWCIARSSGGNMYKNYRYQGQEPSFYFVKNLDRLNKIQQLRDDKYCFFVIQYNNEGKYIVTNSLNDGDKEMSWSEVVQLEPLLQGKESLFKHVPLTDDEKKYYDRFRDGIVDELYENLSYEEKKIYISITNNLNDGKFIETPIDLLNDYITTGTALSEAQLDFIKDKKKLLDNYRRVTLNVIIPEYLKNNGFMLGTRWAILTDEEAIDLYEKKPNKTSHTDILLYKPNLINYFKDDLSDIRASDVVYILKRHPQLVKYFESSLEYFDKYDIEKLLYVQPSMVKYFINRLKDLEKYSIKYILAKHPSLIKYFKDRLDEFSDYDIESLLSYQPTLIKYFENKLGGIDKYSIEKLIDAQPSLKPYFENSGLLNEYPSLVNILRTIRKK